MKGTRQQSYEEYLESFLDGEHGTQMAELAGKVCALDNPAVLLRRADPDFARAMYDGMQPAELHDLLRRVPGKAKQRLARDIKAPFRTWSLTAAVSMLRQLRRAKAPEMMFGLQLIHYAMFEAAPVTSPSWPDAINQQSQRRAAERGIAAMTLDEAIATHGLAACRIGLLGEPNSLREVLSIAQIAAADELRPPSWQDVPGLMEVVPAFLELAAGFAAHRHDDDDHDHDDEDVVDAPFDDDDHDDDHDDAAARPDVEPEASVGDAPVIATPDDEDTGVSPHASVVAENNVDVAAVESPVVQGTAPSILRDETVAALIEMRRLDATIRANVQALERTLGPATLAGQLGALGAPGVEADDLDSLTSAIGAGTATDDEVGFATAVVALAVGAARGASSVELREMDSAARHFQASARFPQLLFDASRWSEPFQAVATDPLLELLRRSMASNEPLPYNDPIVTVTEPARSDEPAGTTTDEPHDEHETAVADVVLVAAPEPTDIDAETEPATDPAAPAADAAQGEASPDGAPYPATALDEDRSDDEPGDQTGEEAGPVGGDVEAVIADASDASDGAAAETVLDGETIIEQLQAASAHVTPAGSDYRSLVAAAISTDRLSLAGHLAEREGDDDRRAIIETACLARALRSPSSALAGAVGTRIGSLYEVHIDQALRPLLAASVARASLVAPATGASAYCQMLMGQGYLEVGPAASAILAALADAGTHGISFSAASAIAASEDAERSVEIEALRAQARAEMQRQGRNMFARATYMMERWREPGSPLFELLDPVISDRRPDAPKVALLASSLRGGGALRLVDDTEDSMRTPKQARVTGTARSSLVKRINAAISIAGQWAELVGATRSVRRSGDAGIRDRLVGQGRALGAELAKLIGGDDRLSSAAAVMAGRLYDEIFAIASGETLAGTELAPDVALDADLLRFGVAFTAGRTTDQDTDLDELVARPFPAFGDALAAYTEARDLSSAGALVTVCDVEGERVHERVARAALLIASTRASSGTLGDSLRA